MISPTRNPSKAGARWLFAQREYLRRVGDTAHNRSVWKIVISRVEALDNLGLLDRIKRLEAERVVATGQRERMLRAELAVVQYERAYRRAAGKDEKTERHAALLKQQAASLGAGNKRNARYRAQIAEEALLDCAEMIGVEAVRALATAAAERVSVREGTDKEALVEELVEQCEWHLGRRTASSG